MTDIDHEAARSDIESVFTNVFSQEFADKYESVAATKSIEDAQRKLEVFKRIIERLRNLNTPQFLKQYQKKLTFGDTTYTSYQKILDGLTDELKPVYDPEEYKVTSEVEWQKKRQDGFSIQEIKNHDKHLRIKIDQKVKQSIIDTTLCTEQNDSPPCQKDDLRSPSCQEEDLRLVIIGKTGVGKSATGNLLIGEPNYFHEDPQAKSTTETVSLGLRKEASGRRIFVLDTPGLFDTNRSEKEIRMELAKCFTIKRFISGVHAFILILNAAAPRFTEEEQKAAATIKKIFGKEAFDCCLLVLTHFDDLLKKDATTNATDYEREIENERLKSFVQDDLAGRLMFIDNHAESKYERGLYRANLVSMADKIQQDRNGDVYTNIIFKQAQERLDQWEIVESELKLTLIQKKWKCFYKAVFDVRLHIRKKYHAKFEEYTKEELLDMILQDVEVKLEKRMKIFAALPDQLTNLCQMTIKEECMNSNDQHEKIMKCCFYKNQEKHSKLLEEVDNVLLANSLFCLSLSTEQRDAYIDKLSGDVVDRLSRNMRQDFDKDFVKTHILGIFNSSFMKDNLATIERIVKNVNREIFSITKDKMMGYPLTTDNLELLKKGEVRTLSKFIMKIINGRLSCEAKKLFSEDDLLKIIEDKVKEEFAGYEDIATKTLNPKNVCFPSNAFVYTLGQKKCLISDLKIGDKVLSIDFRGNLTYEDVILLSHADHATKSFHVSLTVNSGETILLSPMHMLHVEKFGHLKPAKNIQKGDRLLVYKSDRCEWTEATNVSKCLEQGLFCPHTASGSIIVNDVLASCYTESLNPKLSHVLLSAVNILYNTLPVKVYQYLYGRNRLDSTPYLLNFIMSHLSGWNLKMVDEGD